MMINQAALCPIEILLVEDSLSDATLTMRNLEQGKLANRVHWVEDGEAAMEFLRQQGEYAQVPRPGLILLDLNLPGMNGRELLQIVKTDPGLHTIPVIVLTTSDNQADISFVYEMNANCYVTKPIDIGEFVQTVQLLSTFWLTLVQLPE
jgi:two-component system, chemotaxis family, response regulator Rcp1